MGIEYSVRAQSFDLDKAVELMPKITSGSNGHHEVIGTHYYFKFNEDQEIPDLMIQLDNNGAIIVYNGGYMQSWAIVGLFMAVMSEWFSPLKLEEL